MNLLTFSIWVGLFYVGYYGIHICIDSMGYRAIKESEDQLLTFSEHLEPVLASPIPPVRAIRPNEDFVTEELVAEIQPSSKQESISKPIVVKSSGGMNMSELIQLARVGALEYTKAIHFD